MAAPSPCLGPQRGQHGPVEVGGQVASWGEKELPLGQYCCWGQVLCGPGTPPAYHIFLTGTFWTNWNSKQGLEDPTEDQSSQE